MPTRNVVISDHQEAFIGELVRSGRYKNASEVLRESVRLMERRELEEAVKLALLRQRLDMAEQDVVAGHLTDYRPGLLDDIDAQEQDEFHRPRAK